MPGARACVGVMSVDRPHRAMERGRLASRRPCVNEPSCCFLEFILLICPLGRRIEGMSRFDSTVGERFLTTAGCSESSHRARSVVYHMQSWSCCALRVRFILCVCIGCDFVLRCCPDTAEPGASYGKTGVLAPVGIWSKDKGSQSHMHRSRGRSGVSF